MITLYTLSHITGSIVESKKDIPDFKSAIKEVKRRVPEDLREHIVESKVSNEERKSIEERFSKEQREANYILIYSTDIESVWFGISPISNIKYFILLVPKDITFSNQIRMFSPFIGSKWNWNFIFNLLVVYLLGVFIIGIINAVLYSIFNNVSLLVNYTFIFEKGIAICAGMFIGVIVIFLFSSLCVLFTRSVYTLIYDYE